MEASHEYEPTLEGVLAAILSLTERVERGFASMHERLDNANADLEALTRLAHSHGDRVG